MKKQLVLGLFVLVAGVCRAQTPWLATGIVKDKHTNQPIDHCHVFQIHSAQAISTTREGEFQIEIKSDTDRLIFSHLSYTTDTILVSKQKTNYEIFLYQKSELLNEVVVTGVSKATLIKENPLSVAAISTKAIERTNESNIIDVLVKNTPGLNAVKTGPNISKPYIRGLGYNRVLTIYDGVRQEGQQWGD